MSQRRIWLGLTGLGSLLLAMTCWVWWALSSSMLMPSRVDAAQGHRDIVALPESSELTPELFFNDRVSRALNEAGSVQWRQTYRRVGDAVELTLSLRNDAPSAANLNFFLYSTPVAIQVGKHHRIAAEVTMAHTTDLRAQMDVGFHVSGRGGGYLGEWVGPQGWAAWPMPMAQQIETDYLASPSRLFNGHDAGMLAPRLSIINIEPGTEISASVRWRALQVYDDLADAGMIDVGVVPVVRVGAERRLRVRVSGVGVAAGDGFSSEQVLVLRSSSGQEWSLSRPVGDWRQVKRQATSWDWALPEDLPQGDYTLWFGLRTLPAGRWIPLRSLDRAAVDEAGRVRLSAVSLVMPSQTMSVGMSFHRYPGRSESTLGPIRVSYDFARSLAVHGLHAQQWWTGEDQYDWSVLDAWAGYHAKDGRKVIMVFTGSPTWASQRPHEASVMNVPGNAAPPRPAVLPAYGRMVESTLRRLRGRLFAVECWNEPDLIGSYSGTSTELADLCKVVFTQARRVDAAVPVICPQAASPKGMPFVLGARTSEGEPLTQFCDVVGAHVYGALGDDPKGLPYDAMSVAEQLRAMYNYSIAWGVNKPLAVTEYGAAGCVGSPMSGHDRFTAMSAQQAGEALYQSIRAFREGGVSILGLYSYDHEDNDPACRPGGSFLRLTSVNAAREQYVNDEVVEQINQARKDFGH